MGCTVSAKAEIARGPEQDVGLAITSNPHSFRLDKSPLQHQLEEEIGCATAGPRNASRSLSFAQQRFATVCDCFRLVSVRSQTLIWFLCEIRNSESKYRKWAEKLLDEALLCYSDDFGHVMIDCR